MKLVDIILNLFLIGMGILLIYWSIELLFGGSPTLQDFHIAITIIVLGFVYKLNREVGEIRIRMKYEFRLVHQEIAQIHKKLD
jgi:hypothetical protein|tara:strand:- start:110 stop:358 length:249 start_codon:yes stop_codon:yes gene_type:complete